MNLIHLDSLQTPAAEVFGTLTEAQLRNRLEPEKGMFIAESPKVIRVALDAGYEPLSILCEERHIEGDAKDITERCDAFFAERQNEKKTVAKADGGITVYTGSRELLAQLTGYTLTRGVLCAMRRPRPLSVAEVIEGASRVVVIDGVVDSTNIGAIFRSAAALGIDAVLVTPNSCDPFNRRAVRVSMGSVFLVPWTWIGENAECGMQNAELVESARCEANNSEFCTLNSVLRKHSFQTAAMALTDNSLSLDDPRLKEIPRLALIMGTEGDGLPRETIAQADYVVRIPMKHGVDSLNVAAASAVAFWELRK